ncbi:hypothetical protein LL973_18860 [Xanthomonas campestris pv. nigromaculans]|nr:hypothetical protein [Xanthomonas campestris pv. nigromaculans]
MKIHTPVRLAAMQVQGHRKDGELGEHQQHRQHAPHAQPGHAGGQEVDDRIGQHRQFHSGAISLVDADMMGAMAANFTLRMRRVRPAFLKRFTRLLSSPG